jgi:hypothetical protein
MCEQTSTIKYKQGESDLLMDTLCFSIRFLQRRHSTASESIESGDCCVHSAYSTQYLAYRLPAVSDPIDLRLSDKQQWEGEGPSNSHIHFSCYAYAHTAVTNSVVVVLSYCLPLLRLDSVYHTIPGEDGWWFTIIINMWLVWPFGRQLWRDFF